LADLRLFGLIQGILRTFSVLQEQRS
jgi:hypothetical protein